MGVGELRGDRFLLGKLGIAIEIDLGVLQLRLIAVAIGDRLIELRLIRARIDLAEEIALLHRLTLWKSDLDELAGDLAAHDHVVEGNDRADAAQIDRNVMSRTDAATTFASTSGGAGWSAADASPTPV